MFRLNHLFKRTDAVQRCLAAPLARSRHAYFAHRAEQGARSSTLRGIAALQLKVIHYLDLGEQGKVARPTLKPPHGDGSPRTLRAGVGTPMLPSATLSRMPPAGYASRAASRTRQYRPIRTLAK